MVGIVANSAECNNTLILKGFCPVFVSESKVIKALRIAYQQLEGQGIRWSLIGSLSLALQGVNIEPNDIDILTDKEGLYRACQLLWEYQTKRVAFGRTDMFESYLGVFRIFDVKVEIMADFKERAGNEWFSLSDRIIKPKLVKVEEMTVPVSSLEEQLISYERLGRETDFNKIRKIREELSRQKPE